MDENGDGGISFDEWLTFSLQHIIAKAGYVVVDNQQGFESRSDRTKPDSIWKKRIKHFREISDPDTGV